VSSEIDIAAGTKAQLLIDEIHIVRSSLRCHPGAAAAALTTATLYCNNNSNNNNATSYRGSL